MELVYILLLKRVNMDILRKGCTYRTQPSITKTRLFKYTENFTTKNKNFQIKNSDILHDISA